MKHRQQLDLWHRAILKGMQRKTWLLQHLYLSRSEEALLVAIWLSYSSFGMHWKMVKGGMGWEWSLGGRQNEFVKGKGQYGKQLFRNEVTILKYVPSFEVFKTFSVMSTCSILYSCEMPPYVYCREAVAPATEHIQIELLCKNGVVIFPRHKYYGHTAACRACSVNPVCLIRIRSTALEQTES